MIEQVSRKFRTMVDSSKTAWGSSLMPFRFRRRLGQDFLLVHLVRDPRAVCWSTVRSLKKLKQNQASKSPLLRCLQTMVGWTAANLACEAFGKLYPDNYVRIRYEDLVRVPRQKIDEIFRRLSLHTVPALDRLGTGDNRHQLYGNGMRFRPFALGSLKEDSAWKSAMPKGYRRLAALSWPLAAKYGYFRSHS
jgi:hypothetical protein